MFFLNSIKKTPQLQLLDYSEILRDSIDRHNISWDLPGKTVIDGPSTPLTRTDP